MKLKHQFLYILQQVFYWITYCTLVGFASVYLLGKGFTDSQIGILLASTNLISVFVQFIASKLLVPRYHLKTLLQFISISILGVCLLLVIVKPSVFVSILLFATVQTLHMSMLPYINSLGLAYETDFENVDFSVARGFGSMGFAFASFGIGKLLNTYEVDIVPLLALLFSMGFILIISISPADKRLKHEETQSSKSNFFKKYPRFIFLIFALILVFTFHNFINAYLPQIVSSVGGNSGDVGLSLMIAGLCELPAMFMYTKLSRFKSHSFWVMTSFLSYLVRSMILVSIGSVLQVQSAQILQAFSFALLLPSISYLLQEILEVKDRVFGQTLFTIAMTLGGVFGTLFGGFAIDLFGVRGMLMGGVAICCAAALLMLIYLRKKKIKVMI